MTIRPLNDNYFCFVIANIFLLVIASPHEKAWQSKQNRLLRFLAKLRNDGIKFIIASVCKNAKQSILLITKFFTNKKRDN